MNASYRTLPHNITFSSNFFFPPLCWIEKHGKVWRTIKQTTILLEEHPLGVKNKPLHRFCGVTICTVFLLFHVILSWKKKEKKEEEKQTYAYLRNPLPLHHPPNRPNLVSFGGKEGVLDFFDFQCVSIIKFLSHNLKIIIWNLFFYRFVLFEHECHVFKTCLKHG